MTLVEALLALLLLSVCLIPAANALRGAVGAPGQTLQSTRGLDCVGSLMEIVMAEPYDRLLAAAGPLTTPSSYSTVATPACPARSVFIARYGNDARRELGTAGAGNNLLYVSVRLAVATDENVFALTTLVAR